jgi:LacI family transcriptional regulator
LNKKALGTLLKFPLFTKIFEKSLTFSAIFVILPIMTRKRVNQKDIAETLNISVATVSKALRGDYSDINEETRQRVLNMATKLGYDSGSHIQPALEEEERKPCMVGVLILRKYHEWQHTHYFAGMSEKCAKMNVSLIVHYIEEEDSRQILYPENQPPAMRDGQIQGLILANRWPTDVVRTLSESFPCVSLLYDYFPLPIDVVGVDESQGISLLIDRLLTQGHTNIGFFGNCGQVVYARNRFAMYAASLYRVGLPFLPENVCNLGPATLEDKEEDLNGQIEHAVERIEKGVRAWICANDWVGYLLCRGLFDRGFRIPGDVSVAGFDNTEDNTLGCPRLTSISVPALRMGAESLRRLLNRIRYPKSPPLKVLLPVQLFEGQTTGPVPTNV